MMHTFLANEKQDSEPKDPIAAHLEQIIRNAQDAVNRRDFSLPSPTTWDHLAESDLHTSWAHATNHFNHVRGHKEFLEMYKNMTEKWPEYHVTVTDLTTHLKQKGTRADVYANTEVRGAPPGVVRSNLFVTEFAIADDGRWVMVRMQGMGGFGAMGME